ncbi:MAG: hypothetical protein K2Q18_08935, partial [Bdellovibrionales bacterium]|nr:hypothetical protein [Bdellovibrionales bacterium]
EFHILARTRQTDKVQWIALKKETPSEHDQYYGIRLSSENKLEKIKRVLYDNEMESSMDLLKLNGEYFTYRFVERFSSSLSYETVPSDDYHDIILDQAYTLGRIHSRVLGGVVGEYVAAWAKIPAAKVDERAISLKFKMID